MKLQETTDKRRNMIKPHLPKPAKTRRPGADDRTAINAVMLVLITGCTWIDLPVRYGSKSSSDHIEDSNNLQQKGVWKKDSLPFPCAVKSAHEQNRPNLQKKTSAGSSSIPAKKKGGRNAIGHVMMYSRKFQAQKCARCSRGKRTACVSVAVSCANDHHDSTKFAADVMESISEYP